MPIMFRCEHSKKRSLNSSRFGEGIYRINDDLRKLLYSIDNAPHRRPAPGDEGHHFDNFCANMHFGFQSLKHLRCWLKQGVRIKMREIVPELVIRTYVGDDVVYGKKQMMMNCDGAQRLDVYDFVTLEKISSHKDVCRPLAKVLD